MKSDWPFDQPADCAVFSLRQIVLDGAPILSVSHDEEDHGWQFLDNSDAPETADAMLVAFAHIVDSDPTLLELADLPPGWRAWRQSVHSEWTRERKSQEVNAFPEDDLLREALAFPHPDEPAEAALKKTWWKFW